MRLSDEAIAACQEILAPTQTQWGSSRFACWRTCPRAHQLRYHEGVRPKEAADYFSIGILLHAVMAYAARGHVWRELIAYLTTLDNIDLGHVYEVERLEEGYFAHYGDENCGFPDNVEIVDVEVEMAGELGGLPYTGRADLVIRAADQLVIVDHKTRGRKVPDDRDEYRRDLLTRPQLLGLSWLAWQYYSKRDHRGHPLDAPPAVMLNEIVKTKVPQFGRTTITPTERQLRDWAANHSIEVMRSRQELADGGETGLRRLDACAPVIGSRCQFFDWCHGSEETRQLHYNRDGDQ
jgi:hypothetical protein